MVSQIRVHLVTPCGLEGDADGEGSLVHSRGGGPCGGLVPHCWRMGIRELLGVLAAETQRG